MRTKRFLLLFLLIFSINILIFAGGNKEKPSVTESPIDVMYFSPGTDSTKSSGEIKFSATVYVKSKEGYIPKVKLEILDAGGNVLKEVIKEDESELNWFVRIFTGYTAHTLTDQSISWDGLKDDGTAYPDGEYDVKMTITAASNQETIIDDLPKFVIDTSKPNATLTLDSAFENYRTFSPNGDNSKEEFIINQTGSSEIKWLGAILDADGNTVYSEEWTNSEPGQFRWDGKDSDGNEVADGTYSYTLTCTDEALNIASIDPITDIVLDRTATTVTLKEDFSDPRSRAFSPNGDGIKDSITLTPDVPYQEKVSSWIWTLSNSTITTEPVVYWQVSGDSSDIPEQIVFDGKDSDGNEIPETDLDFTFVVSYEHGNVESLLMEQVSDSNFVLDISDPVLTMSFGLGINMVEYPEDYIPVFSPNDDQRKDTAQITLHAAAGEKLDWNAAIYDQQDNELAAIDSTVTTNYIQWPGKDADGNAYADGEYFAKGTFTDYAGNSIDVTRSMMIDNTPVELTMEYTKVFSPNGDGLKDTFDLTVQANLFESVNFWSLKVYPENEDVETVFSDSGNTLESLYQWDGIDRNNGNRAAEGNYDFTFTAIYDKGDLVTEKGSFEVEYIAPTVSMDPIVTNVNKPQLSGFVSEAAEVFVTFGGKTYSVNADNPGEWQIKVPDTIKDGEYSLELVAVDPAGNTGKGTGSLTIDTAAPVITVQNVATKEGSFTLQGTVNDPDAKLAVSIGGKNFNPVPSGNKWSVVVNGLKNGTFDAVATATDKAGNTGKDSSKNEVVVDSIAPKITVEKLETSQSSFTLKGTVDDSSAVVDISIGNKKFKGKISGKNWTVQLSGFGDGVYDVSAQATDALGNVGKDTTKDELTVVLFNAVVSIEPLTTKDDPFTLSGTMKGNATAVNLTIGGKKFSSIIKKQTWSAEISGIADGVYDVVAEASDKFGNTAVDNSKDELTLDTTGAVLTVDPLTIDNAMPRITGTTDDQDAQILVTIDEAAYIATVEGGTWFTDVTAPLMSGTYDVVAEAVDWIGNISTDQSSDELVIELQGPELGFESLATNDTTPEIVGTVDDPEAIITVSVNGEVLDASIEDGSWSAQVENEMAEGFYAVRIEAVNEIGGWTVIDDPQGLQIDIKPPVVDITVAPNPFAKNEDGIEGEAFVTIKVEDDSEIVDWTIDIVEKGKRATPDNTVRSYSGDGDPSDQISWSGQLDAEADNTLIKEFTIILNVTDKGGNKTTFSKDVPLDVVVVKQNGKLYLMVPNIIFGAYKHALDSKGPAMTVRNYESIDKVVEIYTKYPQFGLSLEAHALNIYEPDTERWKKEEQVLLPLTERRAESVRQALVDRGISPDNIVSNAYGGLYPIASTSDSSVWWKNRRVEFIMLPELPELPVIEEEMITDDAPETPASDIVE